LSCGCSFDDYCRKHKIKMHGGVHDIVISFGIENNTFIATQLNFQRKTQVRNHINKVLKKLKNIIKNVTIISTFIINLIFECILILYLLLHYNCILYHL